MVSSIIDAYPDSLALISEHVWDDDYDEQWGNDRAANFYDIPFIPNMWFDGVANPASSTGAYEATILDRQAIPTDVTIFMFAKALAGPTYNVTAEVCIESGGVGKSMRIYMVQVLDYHPNPPSYSRNCFKLAAEPVDITLAPGECQEVERIFTFGTVSWNARDNIKIIGWAQEPHNTAPAEVHQAYTMPWPFPEGRVTIDWVDVGDAGNDDDTHGDGYGGVAYDYKIGQYEVSNGQYIEFLNSVAAVGDANGLFNSDMTDNPLGGIRRTGSGTELDPWVYEEKVAGWADKPVNFVNFYDALRFANWLQNGQPLGIQDASTTEDGTYDMSLGANVVRKPGALVFLTNEDEWYKAAYYKGGGTTAGYWDYPTQSDIAPTAEGPPGTDMVNGSANYNFAVGSLTDVGAYTGKPSDGAYGTFDQGGNVWEWIDLDFFGDGSTRSVRGGYINGPAAQLEAVFRNAEGPEGEAYNKGFRVAGLADCNVNGIPDICDLDCGTPGGFCDVTGCGAGQDCNSNGVPDECDIFAGTSQDCQGDWVPDECQLEGNDCDDNQEPDECQPDCDDDGIPDICELEPIGTSKDCNGNSLPDECDIASGWSNDCQPNGVPDECDVFVNQTSPDTNGNGRPDECEVIAPVCEPGGPACSVPADCTGAWAGADCVGGTCYIPKNRYLSIDPTNPVDVAYQVEITEAGIYPTALGRTWWLDEPQCYDYPNGAIDPDPFPSSCSGPNYFGWVSRLTSSPVTRRWTEAPLHITGCGVVPVVVYEVRATVDEGGQFTDSLEINTIHAPTPPQTWGDVTGGPEDIVPASGYWLAPEGAMGMGDVQAAIRTFENQTEDTGAPPRVWIDVETDQVVSFSDIDFIIKAFAGTAYGDLLDLPNIGWHPADCP